MSTGRHREGYAHYSAAEMRDAVERAEKMIGKLHERVGQLDSHPDPAAAAWAADAQRDAERLTHLVGMLGRPPGARPANRCGECHRDVGDETTMIDKSTTLPICARCVARHSRVKQMTDRRDAADAAERLRMARTAEARARQHLLYTAQGVRYERRHLRIGRLVLAVVGSIVLTVLLVNPLPLVFALVAAVAMLVTYRHLRAEVGLILGPPGTPRAERYRNSGLPTRAALRRAERQHADAVAEHDRALLRVLDAEAAVPEHVAWPQIYPPPS